tara:strand:+ start:620 stop:1366 length:747 start_codon:yes stop_codon:yes gene_type:complete
MSWNDPFTPFTICANFNFFKPDPEPEPEVHTLNGHDQDQDQDQDQMYLLDNTGGDQHKTTYYAYPHHKKYSCSCLDKQPLKNYKTIEIYNGELLCIFDQIDNCSRLINEKTKFKEQIINSLCPNQNIYLIPEMKKSILECVECVIHISNIISIFSNILELSKKIVKLLLNHINKPGNDTKCLQTDLIKTKTDISENWSAADRLSSHIHSCINGIVYDLNHYLMNSLQLDHQTDNSIKILLTVLRKCNT